MTTTITPTTRLDAAFRRTRKAGRAALIGYLPAGYPDISSSIEALRTLSWHVDVLEVGLPYGKPALDGPDITRATRTALASGTTPAVVMEILRETTATTSVPVVLMSYWEPIRSIGPEAMAAAVAATGAAGVILPDLHPSGRGAARWLTAAARHGIATTFLAGEGQLSDAAANSTNWIYLPASPGTTGTGVLDLANLRHRARQVRQLTHAPICTGMGISSPELAAAVAPVVDGVVVGSAFVRAVQRTAGGRVDLGLLDHRAARYAATLREVPGGRPPALAAS